MFDPALPPKVLYAGVVVLRRENAGYRLLCLRAFETWDFPKALVAGDDDPLRAAVKEARDATGIHDLALRWGEDYRETIPFADGRVSRYYLAQTGAPDVALRLPAGPKGAEDYEYRWVTFDEAEDILPPRLELILQWAARRLAGGHSRNAS